MITDYKIVILFLIEQKSIFKTQSLFTKAANAYHFLRIRILVIFMTEILIFSQSDNSFNDLEAAAIVRSIKRSGPTLPAGRPIKLVEFSFSNFQVTSFTIGPAATVSS